MSPLLALVFAVYLIAMLRGSKRFSSKGLAAFVATAQKQRDSARSAQQPHPDNLDSQAPVTGAEQMLLQTIKDARLAGSPIDRALWAMVQVLRRAEATHRHRRRLWGLVSGRFAFGLVLSCLARWFLGAVFPVTLGQIGTMTDQAAILAATLMMAIALFSLQALIPGSWVWTDGLSKPALAWLRSYLLLDEEGPASDVLKSLKQRELLLGISLTMEKHAALNDWVEQEGGREQEAFQRFEDFLPLFELFGLGLPCLLLVLSPAQSLF